MRESCTMFPLIDPEIQAKIKGVFSRQGLQSPNAQCLPELCPMLVLTMAPLFLEA